MWTVRQQTVRCDSKPFSDPVQLSAGALTLGGRVAWRRERSLKARGNVLASMDRHVIVDCYHGDLFSS